MYANVSSTEKLDMRRLSLISDETTRALHWFLYAILCQAIAIFGVVCNVINFLCFMKQGFRDPVNVSLFGLAVSDLGCLITLMWSNLCYTPAFRDADLTFDPFDLQYVTGTYVHTTFSRITAWITAIITLERCLCITIPLKVRNIFTSKRMMLLTASLFVIFLSSIIPGCLVNRLGMKFFPARNKTLLGNIAAANGVIVDTISFLINNTLLPFTAFVVIIVCTITLVYKLNANSRWRMASSKTTQAINNSTRNIKVAKMVTTIAVLFICCFSPLGIIFIAMCTEPKLSAHGQYVNILTVLGAVCLLLEAINSSSNIFIYFYMSTKYREVLRTLCSTDSICNN